MKTTPWDERFFASTRGQVVDLIRRGHSTVDELAGALGLTDNAIRGHLLALERDGMVRQGERRRTGGKPSYTYQLTPEAEQLFPKAYAALLAGLLRLMQERLSSEQMGELLTEVGRRIASEQPASTGTPKERVEQAQALLETMGGLSRIEEVSDGYVIAGCSCPLAAAVEGSSDACLIAEALLSTVTGMPVRQVCDPGPPPRCRFELFTTHNGNAVNRTAEEGIMKA